MNLRQIEVFRAVMLTGTVTGAARMLHVSQPGISRMLGHIERALSMTLFERSPGKLRPTPEAEALYAEVEQVYKGVQRVYEFSRDLKAGRGLSLRVLASPSTALEVVPEAVAALAQQYPTAKIYMETQLVREMIGQLVRHEADIAISTLPIDQAPLVAEAIGGWSLACVFAAGHPFSQRRTVGMRDLRSERLVAFSADTPQGRLIGDWWRANQWTQHGQIEVRSGQVACAMVVCGAGVAVVDVLTARALQSDRLGYRPLSKGPKHEIFAVRNGLFVNSRMAQSFVELVRGILVRRRSTRGTRS